MMVNIDPTVVSHHPGAARGRFSGAPMMKTFSFIAGHPLTRDRRLAAAARYLRWQVESRLRPEVEFEWIEGARLLVKNGMTGATGNIYCGLHEFADMAFLLHLLRPGDLFVDVGANIGSYTVLASAVCGAQAVAIEPDPVTMAALKRNIASNAIESRVRTVEAAMAGEAGLARFTVGLDTVNHISTGDGADVRQVRAERLDDVLAGQGPTFIKLDVEGFEASVLAGALETLEHPSLLAIETEGRQPEVLDRLAAAGFIQCAYDAFARRLTRGVEDAGTNNALFVRDFDAVEYRLSSAAKRRILGKLI